eukprot:CAMPEP_0175843726 /NCGR_PEP_ID=MMETSP0107_2-20121207/21242_1 /TAXON_ID=195067 ORGANISM="Goniomonas pacifica, Strain CCMP1869" /NCGR_SAMPLE_ID=MMETSP0107_2 /ASSEMBLY_ACC=CAM_ASM_000203 /LENGTH=61 /DNA_ID=CAMNT_0017158031 /DNA_START=10 /DNA_END=192 /DNA_ORIENTATION=-
MLAVHIGALTKSCLDAPLVSEPPRSVPELVIFSPTTSNTRTPKFQRQLIPVANNLTQRGAH